MYGKVCGKIIRRKNKTGNSYNFLIVKNRRNPMNGKAEYQVVWNFGTIRSEQLSDNQTQLEFWKEVALVLTNLIKEGKIYQNCGSEIKTKFEKYVKLPVVKNVAPIAIAKQVTNPSIEERLRERFKGLL